MSVHNENENRKVPRILFFTPFNFVQPHHDEEFDRLLDSQLEHKGIREVVAEHAGRFDATSENYEELQADAIIRGLKSAETRGFDAFVVACHYDPAVVATREAAKIPVIAPLQLMVGLAAQHGSKFAVISDLSEAIPVITDLIHGYGHGDSCVEVVAIDMDGDAILDDTLAAAKAVDHLVERIESAGEISSVVLGCTIVSSAYEKHRAVLPKRGVRVLNSNLLTVQGAAMLVQD